MQQRLGLGSVFSFIIRWLSAIPCRWAPSDARFPYPQLLESVASSAPATLASPGAGGSIMAGSRRMHSSLAPSGLPHAVVCRIGYQVVAALAHMHLNGYFHRDVKPDNVLIRRRATARASRAAEAMASVGGSGGSGTGTTSGAAQ